MPSSVRFVACATALWVASLSSFHIGVRRAEVQGAGVTATPEFVSLVTTPIYLEKAGRRLSQGTGFFFATTTPQGIPDAVFLVTNVHVLTGHLPGTEDHDGDSITFLVHTDTSNPRFVNEIHLDLFRPDGTPRWIISTSVPAADVALLRVPTNEFTGSSQPVLTELHTRGQIKVRLGLKVSLIGYPLNLIDFAHQLPIWKTGHIATEPSLDYQGRPVFLADVSASHGMSGAPVVVVSRGVHEDEEGRMVDGEVVRLLGVFSGFPVSSSSMPSSADASAGLARIWKADILVEMAKSQG